MKRSPPPAMRKVPLPLQFAPADYAEGRPAARSNPARFQGNSMFIPSLSKWAPSYAEADAAAAAANRAAAAERQQAGIAYLANHPVDRLDPATLAAMPQAPPQNIDLRQPGPTSVPNIPVCPTNVRNTPAQHPVPTQRLSPPARRPATLTLRPSAQPLSDTTNNAYAVLEKLLQEQQDLVEALKKENEDLKKENANLKDLAKNRPMYG